MRSLILAALLPTMSMAWDLTPDSGAILIGSHHAGASYDFNETNPGVFLGWDCREITARAGVYKNSYSNTSTALTFTHDALSLSVGGLNAHLFAGVALYPETGRHEVVSIGGSDWIAVGGVEFTHDDLPVFAQVLPGDEKNVDWIGAVGLRFDF